jgi:hypothetical protein
MAVARPQCMLLDGDPTKQVVIPAMRLWHKSLITSGFCLTRPRNITCTPGVGELDVPFVVRPLRWFFCLDGCGSFHFVPCIPPFLDALVYLWLAGFHHITTSTNIKLVIDLIIDERQPLWKHSLLHLWHEIMNKTKWKEKDRSINQPR